MLEGQAEFVAAASEETLQRVAEKLRGRNIEALVVEDGDEARTAVLARLPKGSEVHSGKSKTLQDAGILDAIEDLGFDTFTVRARLGTRARAGVLWSVWRGSGANLPSIVTDLSPGTRTRSRGMMRWA